MKKFITFLMFICTIPAAFADHITGGEMYYRLTSAVGGQYKYAVTIKMYMLCSSERQFNDPTTVSIFNRGTGDRITNISVSLSNTEILNLTNPNKCITNPPTVCYRVGYYNFEVALPVSEEGYVIAAQIVFRINGIKNLVYNYGNIGATYTAEIPGTDNGTGAAANSSARFTGDDLVVICGDNSFAYNFGAQDPDGDQLRYSLCNAYQGGSSGFGNNSPPPPPPPYESVPYGAGYNGSTPLGTAVTIDPMTGVIRGIAPTSGIYVVTVCVTEFRNGKPIATQRKDLQINIASCFIAAASLRPEYMLCKDSKTLNLQNLSTSPLIKTYQWEMFDAEGSNFYNSVESNLSYTFADTGSYKVRLIINKDDLCADSSESIVRVYPGFNPGFDFTGICFGRPTVFKDRTTTVYGAVSRWQWDFPTQPEPPLTDKNPEFTFNKMGANPARLIVFNSNGCIDTVTKSISIIDKPPLDLAFRDTLICVNDQLQLTAHAAGNFTWSTSNQIIASNSNSVTIAPRVTTTYYADIEDNSCKNRDSVLVRVTDHVDLNAMPDTTVCTGDAISLRVQSNGLKYTWTPATGLNDPTLAAPLASPVAMTTYSVIARIGGCFASDAVVVKTVPYPVAFAGNDTLICFNTAAQLHGLMDGRTFLWEPTSSITNASGLNPIAKPKSTTAYVLSVYDVKGCPKPGKDTVVVQVLPKIQAYAGGDTAAVIGQPLQLHASGGTIYKWSPALGLSADDIADPIARYTNSSVALRYKVYVSNEAGCTDSAFIGVKVFNTMPSVLVPNAFTPNGDGRNDLFRFITAGIQKIEYFQVYNRWGQIVFRAYSEEDGWDGTIAGKPQPSGTFVWMVKAVDYTGASFSKQGTLTLIR